MRVVSVYFMVGMLLILTACGSKTVMDKLKSDTVYPELDPPFFAKELKNKTALWLDAWEYCRITAQKPNCAAVVQVGIMGSGSMEVPDYGSSGEAIEVFYG